MKYIYLYFLLFSVAFLEGKFFLWSRLASLYARCDLSASPFSAKTSPNVCNSFTVAAISFDVSPLIDFRFSVRAIRSVINSLKVPIALSYSPLRLSISALCSNRRICTLPFASSPIFSSDSILFCSIIETIA